MTSGRCCRLRLGKYRYAPQYALSNDTLLRILVAYSALRNKPLFTSRGKARTSLRLSTGVEARLRLFAASVATVNALVA